MSLNRPNLITIVADDHRGSALGKVGRESVRTPNLDGLCEHGMRMTNLRTEGGWCRAVCIPSRASLYSGRSVFNATEDREGRTLKASVPILPEILRQNGYHCEHIGKWHQDVSSLKRGFDYGHYIFTGGFGDPFNLPYRTWEDLDDRSAKERINANYAAYSFRDQALSFLKERARHSRVGDPFHLNVAFTLPHDPFFPPKEWEIDRDFLPELPPSFMEQHPFDIGDLDVRDECLLQRPLQSDAVREMTARYYGLIECIDGVVGEINETLESLGLADNTYILYTSDHGLCGGRHGLLGKQNLYDASLLIPGIISGPKFNSEAICTDLISQTDLTPTLLNLLGIPCDSFGFDGRVISELMGDGEIRHDKRSYQYARYKDYQRMVTDGRNKLIVTRVGGDLVIQLFDLMQDPEELCDISKLSSSRSILEELVNLLNRWLIESRDICEDPFEPVVIS